LRGALAPRSRRALPCFTQEQFRREQDEEQVRLRIHRSEDASAECEAVLLDVHIPRSPFAENSDGILESIPDLTEKEIAIPRGARAGIA
jgi:hypothetical protein